jgi:glutamate/tyrosine decarboxylase-like PLP-dependent enzyme
MLADLYHAPEAGEHAAFGTTTIGSSEAFMLAGIVNEIKRGEERSERVSN